MNVSTITGTLTIPVIASAWKVHPGQEDLYRGAPHSGWFIVTEISPSLAVLLQISCNY